MSFCFYIPATQLKLELIQKTGASHREFAKSQGTDSHCYHVWRGKTSRGVHLFSQDSLTVIRTLSMASDDDMALARELALNFAQFYQVPIGADDLPHMPSGEALSPVKGVQASYSVRQVQEWADDWHLPLRDFHLRSLIEVLDFKSGTKKVAVFSGPFRQTFVGVHTLNEASQGLGEEYTSLALGTNLTSFLVYCQSLSGPATRLRFHDSIESSTGDTLGEDSWGPISAEDPWCPSPHLTLTLPDAVGTDTLAFAPPKDRDVVFYATVSRGGPACFVSYVDYMGIQDDDSSWLFIRFTEFMGLMYHPQQIEASRVQPFDEGTMLLKPLNDEWHAALLNEVRSVPHRRLPHRPAFLCTYEDMVETNELRFVSYGTDSG